MNILIVNGFDTYEHRVDLLMQVFRQSGHRATALASDFRHFEKIHRSDQKQDFIFFHANPYKKNLSVQRLYSHYKLAKDIFRYVDTHAAEVDLIWILVPPNSFVKEAIRVKQEHPQIKMVFDLIDLWPETLPIGSMKNYFPFTIWKNLRDGYIGQADFVVSECNLYQERLEKVLVNIPSQTIYLARPVQAYIPQLQLPEDQMSLCYLGSINNIIDIEAISQIITSCKQVKPVTLHIIGDGENREALISSAKASDAEIVFHGKIYDREEKQKILDSCHYGLNIMKKTVCVGLTMKSMDYMEFGLPLINNIQGDTWKIVEKYGIGINVGTTYSIPDSYSLDMRQKTRAYFKENLSFEEFTKQVHTILHQMQ